MDAHRDDIDRMVEIMCAQAAVDGWVDGRIDVYDMLEGQIAKNYTVDFQRPASHVVVLTGKALWSKPASGLLSTKERNKRFDMADFLTAYAPVKDFEGGWCDVLGDAGGETYAGISRRFFPDWEGWTVIDTAKRSLGGRPKASVLNGLLASGTRLAHLVADFYRREWWNRLGLDDLPQPVADEIFEQSVNLGQAGAGRYVQRLCNAFNLGIADRPLYPDLAEDGVIGPRTLAALAALLNGRTNTAAVVHALNCLQGAHYIRRAAEAPSQRRFLDGWMLRTHDPE